MLILARRIGETVMIGDDISITITAISDREVRIGISAPRELPVHRLEIYERNQLKKRLATPTTD